MHRILDRPTVALIVLLGSLTAAIGVRAEQRSKNGNELLDGLRRRNIPAESGARAQEKPKTDAAAKTPTKTDAALKAEETYKTVCLVCHLADGKGLIPDMSFSDGVWKHGSKTEDVVKIITDGAPGTLMLAFKDKFTKEEIAELAKIVRSFDPKLKGKK